MILSVHLLAGAAIGSRLLPSSAQDFGRARHGYGGQAKIKNYWIIFILALLSHFILDAIPHWEYAVQLTGASGNEFLTTTVKALLDILIGVSAIGWLLKSSRLVQPAFWGALFALLPDGLIFIYALAQVFFGWRLDFLSYPIAFHDKFHFTDGTTFIFWRVSAEIIVAAIAIFTLWQARLATRQRK